MKVAYCRSAAPLFCIVFMDFYHSRLPPSCVSHPDLTLVLYSSCWSVGSKNPQPTLYMYVAIICCSWSPMQPIHFTTNGFQYCSAHLTEWFISITSLHIYPLEVFDEGCDKFSVQGITVNFLVSPHCTQCTAHGPWTVWCIVQSTGDGSCGLKKKNNFFVKFTVGKVCYWSLEITPVDTQTWFKNKIHLIL